MGRFALISAQLLTFNPLLTLLPSFRDLFHLPTSFPLTSIARLLISTRLSPFDFLSALLSTSISFPPIYETLPPFLLTFTQAQSFFSAQLSDGYFFSAHLSNVRLG
jgi:hypothetical protein